MLIELSAGKVTETRDLNENILVEFDASGKLVSMTIEHAKTQANVEEFVFHPGQRVGQEVYKVAEGGPEYKTRKEDAL